VGTEIPKLDLSRVQAALGQDEQGRPTVVLVDGSIEIVLFGGDSYKDNLAGACRVAGALWDYRQQHAGEGRQAEEPITVTYSQGGVSEASIVDEERIRELRGSSPSVSGAY
jgi:hypothetical protein